MIDPEHMKESVEKMSNGFVMPGLLGSHNVEVVTGVNLPMLLKVFTCREKPLAELAKLAGEAGTKGIVVAGSMLRSRNKEKTGD